MPALARVLASIRGVRGWRGLQHHATSKLGAGASVAPRDRCGLARDR
jgi:hypothetical protein